MVVRPSRSPWLQGRTISPVDSVEAEVVLVVVVEDSVAAAVVCATATAEDLADVVVLVEVAEAAVDEVVDLHQVG